MMLKQLLAVAVLIGTISAYEIVPRASRMRDPSEIRRAPLPSISSFAPLAKSLRPKSTGVRRAPSVPSPTVRKAYKPQAPAPRAPLSPPPMVPMMPMGLPQFIPIPVPVPQFQHVDHPAFEMPTLGTLPPHTFPPHTFPTFTPIPGMPTMAGLTMPPSFQRLLGITTSTMKPEPMMKHVEDRDQEDQSSSETRRSPQSEGSESSDKKDLNTIRSRLSKFVRGSDRKSSKGEENADWIVPFH